MRMLRIRMMGDRQSEERQPGKVYLENGH